MVRQIKIVDSSKGLQELKAHFMSCKMIGIDVEHYNNLNEEFVCLVQISGMGKTYLIDALKVKKEHIR